MTLPPPSPTAFRALHVGDLHFWKIPLNPLAYFGKRLLGVANLVIGGRGKRFRQELAPRMGERLGELAPDLYLFSGDFSSTAATAEFLAARRFLEPLVQAARLGAHAVPGNHDCYLRREVGAGSFCRHLGDVMRPVRSSSFNMLADGICLAQFNAATSNGLGSHGRVTAEHLRSLQEYVEGHRGEIRSIWLLCHFPAEDPPKVLRHDRGPQLRNHVPLLEMLRGFALPVLWLHGHHHHRWIYGSPTCPQLTYLNAGAPFMRRGLTAPDLGFHELVWDGTLQIRTHRVSSESDRWIEKVVNPVEAGEFCDLQSWES